MRRGTRSASWLPAVVAMVVLVGCAARDSRGAGAGGERGDGTTAAAPAAGSSDGVTTPAASEPAPVVGDGPTTTGAPPSTSDAPERPVPPGSRRPGVDTLPSVTGPTVPDPDVVRPEVPGSTSPVTVASTTVPLRVPTTTAPPTTTTTSPPRPPVVGPLTFERFDHNGEYGFFAYSADRCARSYWRLDGPGSIGGTQGKAPWEPGGGTIRGCFADPHQVFTNLLVSPAALPPGDYTISLTLTSREGVRSAPSTLDFEVP